MMRLFQQACAPHLVPMKDAGLVLTAWLGTPTPPPSMAPLDHPLPAACSFSGSWTCHSNRLRLCHTLAAVSSTIHVCWSSRRQRSCRMLTAFKHSAHPRFSYILRLGHMMMTALRHSNHMPGHLPRCCNKLLSISGKAHKLSLQLAPCRQAAALSTSKQQQQASTRPR